MPTLRNARPLGDTRSSICRSYAPCARWLHSVPETPCVPASCGASFDELLATYMSSAFSSASGDTTYSGTHRLYRCQCYGHLSFEMLYSFRYQMLAQLLSFKYLPACHLPQASRACGREEQALISKVSGGVGFCGISRQVCTDQGLGYERALRFMISGSERAE